MRRALSLWGILAIVLLTGTGDALAQLEAARDAERTGRYEDALQEYRRLASDGDLAAARGLVRTLVAVGRYDDAERAARHHIEQHGASAELSNALGTVLWARGDRDGAAEAFRRAGSADDSFLARLNSAVLRFERGAIDSAMPVFAQFIDLYNRDRQLSSRELTAVATALRYLGREDPQRFKDAVRVYDEAIAADPGNPEPRVLLAELFLEKYNSSDAAETLDPVLEVNPAHARALLARARLLHFDRSPDAAEYARRALETNPNLVEARAFLARLHVELENYGAAVNEATRALEVDPGSIPALAALAAARYLNGDQAGFAEARDRALSVNPRCAELYNTLAELAARNRLFPEAVSFAQSAVELDPGSWRAYGLLGLNQLRVGAMEEGRSNLEVAFRGDPYDVWIKNTLDLLDVLARFEEKTSPRFRFVIEESESDLMSLYMRDLAEEAYDRLAERYGYRPPTPIRIELYSRHADFSVRTVGLVGLGALGVSFGPVIAMDAPSARAAGDFNWGSTLWHELAHTFHLGLSDNRMPRWFGEGLAVFEERHARPGWGDDVSPGFLTAYRNGRLLPVSELNNGFVRPTYPQQIVFSYYQASLVCELIERDHGFDALLEMLEAYRSGRDTEEVFRTVLGVELAAFDEWFDDYLRQRFAAPLAALGDEPSSYPDEPDQLVRRARAEPGSFGLQLLAGRALYEADRLQEAVPFLVRAKELFPGYAGDGSPHWYLAEIHRRAGRHERAADELAALTAIDETHQRGLLALADLREGAGDTVGAAAALERAMYIHPLDPETHTRLAELYGALGDWERAVRERRAVVALDPVDRAEALYRLALARYRGGDVRGARLDVLRALEIAPNFVQAQELLLTIHSGGSESR